MLLFIMTCKCTDKETCSQCCDKDISKVIIGRTRCNKHALNLYI